MGDPFLDLVRLFSISLQFEIPWLQVVGDRACYRQHLVFGYVNRIFPMPCKTEWQYASDQSGQRIRQTVKVRGLLRSI